MPAEQPTRRVRRTRGLLCCGCVVAVFVGLVGAVVWHIGDEMLENFAERGEANHRAKNARTIPDLKLDLVWIAPGRFRMGTPEPGIPMRWYHDVRQKFSDLPDPDEFFKDERPVMWVNLTRPFWLGRTAVTQVQYEAVMGANPSYFKGDDLPVETVSWDDAMEFCQKLTARERAAGRLPAGHIYTLPTEAQWEYACRAGTTEDDEGNLDAVAWYNRTSAGTTHPVGTKQPNAWGLADMHGNVWQWCLDWDAPYPGGEVTDPTGPPGGSRRIFRGGCWSSVADRCSSAFRDYDPPENRIFNVGFRIALMPSP